MSASAETLFMAANGTKLTRRRDDARVVTLRWSVF
jgi:hypothetical protein